MSGYDLNEIRHEHRYPSHHYRIAETMLGAGGFASASAFNALARRPVYAGIHRHIVLAALGAFIGHKLVDLRNSNLRDQQIVYEDYMRLHAEEFTKPDNAPKYKDVLRDWYQTR